jgi:hypothetical protein
MAPGDPDRKPAFEIPNPEEYNLWVFKIQRVARVTKSKIFSLHKGDPVEWYQRERP